VRILIVVAYFPPEIGSAAHVYFDLARAFARRGHEVDVITTDPREYNLEAADRERTFPLDEEMEGVRVHRVRHSNTRDNIVKRGLEHFLLPGYYFRRYRELGRRFDVCLFYIPPLPLSNLARRIRKVDGTPSVLNFQDFHPQELTDVGVMKNPVLIRIMERIERRAYRDADFITVLSGGGVEYVVERGGRPARIAHIYNSVSLDEIGAYLEQKTFKRDAGIEGKILLSYAGILSPYQGIDNILDAARELRDRPEIVVYIAGDGSNKKHLEDRIAAEGIDNVRLVPFLPRNEYFNLVNSTDISFVSLDERMMAPCLPGKTINLMAAGQPIVAMVPGRSETARVVEEAGCGRVVPPGDVKALRDAVLELAGHPELRAELGESGRRYLVDHMNLETAVQRYEMIFSGLLDRGDGI
jgi:glycosyltransferase involved in cell wall biosynthesis